MKKIIFACLFLGVCMHNTMAQDILITTKGDTLRGKLSIFKSRQSGELINIKVNKKKQQFRLFDVSRFYKKGEAYKPIFAQGRYRVAKIVSEGYLSHYLYTPTSHDPKPDFSQPLLFKENGDHIDIPKALMFRKVLMQFLSDCPLVVQRLDERVYTRNQIAIIIRDYNACSLSQQAEIAKQESLEAKIENLRDLLKKSNKVDNKTEVRQMITDMEEKVSAKEDIPSYLKNALSDALKNDLELISLLQEIFDY